MKHVLQKTVLIAGLALTTMRAIASPDVDLMSDIEVSEYAVRMSSVMERMQHYHLCDSQDTQCQRDEFTRHGLSYDDKETVQKRLVIMIGSIY